MSKYKRSHWAEEAGIWHDLLGVPWKQSDSEEYAWAWWNDTDRAYIERSGLPEHVLLDALVEIIGQLNDELEQRRNA